MIAKITLATMAAALLAVCTEPVAAEFKSAKECVPGAKVQTRQNKTGTITAVERGGMCQVQFADGSKTSTLFWMLRAAGSSAAATGKLVPGTYPCYSSTGGTLNYLFMDIVIDGPDSYRDKSGKGGKYRHDAASGKIVFSSGPLAKANAKFLNGPRIGLNMNGGSFFNTTCGLKK